MSDFDLKIELTPEALALLAAYPEKTRIAAEKMAEALDHQNELTISLAQSEKLSASGPDTLGVRTGLLRRSLRRSDATVSADEITGAIGTNVKYAGVHEFGFDGDVSVQPFTRRQRSRDILGGKSHKKVLSAGIAFVKGFTRHMRMPERSFIRSSISERLEQYGEGLSSAILEALGGAA